MTRTVGVALGGGGAKGLAHIAFLEVFDELGVKVDRIAGTSIGAVIGALYAALGSGAAVRAAISEMLTEPRSLDELFERGRLFGWRELLSIELGRGHLLQVDALTTELSSMMGVERFDELNIPLQVVAADFWRREEVVLDAGELMPAIAASFCLPGVFKPVVVDDRVLVDGGCVNPVPFDLLRANCDVVVAVDVLGKRVPDDDLLPSFAEAVFNTFQIAEKTIAVQKQLSHPPDVYLEPAIEGVKVLEFDKADDVYRQVEADCTELRRALTRLLDG